MRRLIAPLLMAASACGRAAPPPPPTFTHDIAPIVFANCAPCHRSGGVAPFPLLSYADVAKHADSVVEQTSMRHMPPWLPDHGEFPIVGERRLTDAQIDLLKRWAAGGRLEGNAAELPKPPVFTDGWELGKPDVVVTAAKPYIAAPGTEDIYRNLVLRAPVNADSYVRAVEFKTGGAPIHHAVIRVDPTAVSRGRDGEDGQPGFEGMMVQNIQDPDGHFIGWAPGRGPILAPTGMPWRLTRGADLVVELHLLSVEKPTVVQPTIGLFLTTTPPTATPVTVTMNSKMIDIPAGKADYVVSETYELPVPLQVMSVYPHAHYLARDMLVTAVGPDGTSKTLLHIPHWSFHWQQDYRFATPVSLPRGTRLTMRYVYDNSDKNADNPHTPPVRVRLGPKSTDEMAQLGLQVLPQSVADAAKLIQAFDDHDILANIAVGELRVQEEPNSLEYRQFLGASYVEAGRFTDAIPQLEAALRLDERSASAHNDLGSALLAVGRVAEALTHHQRAADLAPKNETMQFNLGNALSRASRPAAAAAAYARALAINPDFPDAHVNFGSLLMAQGRVREALPHFERAAELRPNSAVIHTDLSSALAASGRYAEAMREVRRALELNPDYPPALDNLKRLQQMGIK